MKKKIYITIVFVLATVTLSAQTRFSGKTWSIGAGARVGLGSMMQKSEGESSDRTKGFDGAAEGVFTFYFAHKKKNMPH